MDAKNRLGLRRLVESRARDVVRWLNAHGADIGPRWDRPWRSPARNRPSFEHSAKGGPLACLIEGFLKVEAGGKWADYLKSLASCGIHTWPKVMLRPSQVDCDFTINAELRGGKPYFEIGPIGEKGVVLAYFNFLAQVREVNRIRLCPNCRRWFFARRTDSKICSPRCQHSASRKTPEARAKRAAYMRKYRATVRKLDGKYVKYDLKGKRRKESRRVRRLG